MLGTIELHGGHYDFDGQQWDGPDSRIVDGLNHEYVAGGIMGMDGAGENPNLLLQAASDSLGATVVKWVDDDFPVEFSDMVLFDGKPQGRTAVADQLIRAGCEPSFIVEFLATAKKAEPDEVEAKTEPDDDGPATITTPLHSDTEAAGGEPPLDATTDTGDEDEGDSNVNAKGCPCKDKKKKDDEGCGCEECEAKFAAPAALKPLQLLLGALSAQSIFYKTARWQNAGKKPPFDKLHDDAEDEATGLGEKLVEAFGADAVELTTICPITWAWLLKWHVEKTAVAGGIVSEESVMDAIAKVRNAGKVPASLDTFLTGLEACHKTTYGTLNAATVDF